MFTLYTTPVYDHYPNSVSVFLSASRTTIVMIMKWLVFWTVASAANVTFTIRAFVSWRMCFYFFEQLFVVAFFCHDITFSQ